MRPGAEQWITSTHVKYVQVSAHNQSFSYQEDDTINPYVLHCNWQITLAIHDHLACRAVTKVSKVKAIIVNTVLCYQ